MTATIDYTQISYSVEMHDGTRRTFSTDNFEAMLLDYRKMKRSHLKRNRCNRHSLLWKFEGQENWSLLLEK